MLTKEGLKAAIKQSMSELPPGNLSAQAAHNKMADALKSYLESNAEFHFLWTAAMTVSPFTIDLRTTWVGKISFASSILLTPPPNVGVYGPMISSQVVSGLITPDESLLLPGETIVVVPPISLLYSPPATGIVIAQSGASDPDSALDAFVDQFITGFKTMVPAGSFLPATHTLAAIVYTATANSLTLIK